MSEFASSKYTAGQLNAMVKKLRKLGGESGPEQLLNDKLALVTPGQSPLLKILGESLELPAVSRFVAKEAFTKANGIAWMGDNFKQFILPLVEENVAAAVLTVSELTRDAKDLRIAAELRVDEQGEVALAHFFRVFQDCPTGIRTDGWANGAYVIGNDGETWAVDARLYGGGWSVFADRLGNRRGGAAGYRFLSR